MTTAMQFDQPKLAEQPKVTSAKHERKSSKENASSKPQDAGNASLNPPQQSQWQQATSRKGHKKSKSNGGTNALNGSGGQPLPANEAERKGG
jgi:hypothetical protein